MVPEIKIRKKARVRISCNRNTKMKKKKKKQSSYVNLTIIKNGNDENHKRREVKFPEASQQHKT